MKKIDAEVGIDNGLKFTLDLQSNSESFGTVLQDYAAFRVFIGQPSEFPSMKQNSLLIEPGRQHFLSLSTEVFSASGIKHLDPKDRKCYFPNEGNLQFYEKYTFGNCKFECKMNATKSNFGCTPWFLPHISNSSVCDPWTERGFMKELGKINNECDKCLPDCQSSETSVVASSAKFR